jgi:hypothetical protein
MELNIPGWIVSPRSLNSHMTAPQQTAANTEKYLESGGTGLTAEDAVDDMLYGAGARGMKDATTREQTYSTIWVKGNEVTEQCH